MSGKVVSMRNAREVLRLRIGQGLTIREVASGCGVSPSTVLEYEKRFIESGISWPLPEDLDDVALGRVLRSGQPSGPTRQMPDIGYIVKQLRRKHVTMQLLWVEYREAFPEGYGYTQFCHWIKQQRAELDVTLRQEHKAGEKVFTDYAGATIPFIDPKTGEVVQTNLFVAALGASSFIYAEATLDMSEANWIGSHVRLFEFLGGVPEIIVPDNTKCAVIRPDRYEPDLNPSFSEMAAHYGAAVIPARVRKPRDKAIVEVSVQIAQRWVVAALRNRTFHSLAEINEAISELLERINNRKFRAIDATRKELFNKIDKPALKPLPATRYVYGEWRKATVSIDYHVAVYKHYYSVPYRFAGKRVDVRLSALTVEVFLNNKRIASHPRSHLVGGYSTHREHMPASHQRYLEWMPSRIINWAAATGPATAELVKKILNMRPHPEQGFRSCLGIISLSRKYGPSRVEAAARRSLAIRSYSYTSVKSILEKKLDSQPIKGQLEFACVSTHSNIRGRDYYRN
ncbi:MAG: IS21 family transposase [Actinobacteria bacterium]|nr:IS21 family transposase [Actinomycetota bacterium]